MVKRTGKTNNGFTLLELAIVLVIIGILIVAVIKGQSMIENSKIKAVAEQSKGLMAAVYAYQEKYGQLPGDDTLATTHLAQSGCSVVNGNGDGLINEYFAALEHLACGGFITGSYNGTSDQMWHKFDGNVLIYVNGGGVNLLSNYKNMLRFDNLPGSVAEAVDRILDDGVWNTGSARGSSAYTNNTVTFGVGI
ncbi:MAG: prepilin-type N-terminal cleavage/methylation domain-containing protein [Deltaproteobacteria bacterium]|nr:prepilin-type N-terminal cleavage/methylation domain-containing protein [Deltaproteobacteria bacterium]